jgi:hypothetical protein
MLDRPRQPIETSHDQGIAVSDKINSQPRNRRESGECRLSRGE